FILIMVIFVFFFFFSSRRRHTRFSRDWSSDVCSSDLYSSSWFRTATRTTNTVLILRLLNVPCAAGDSAGCSAVYISSHPAYSRLPRDILLISAPQCINVRTLSRQIAVFVKYIL